MRTTTTALLTLFLGLGLGCGSKDKVAPIPDAGAMGDGHLASGGWPATGGALGSGGQRTPTGGTSAASGGTATVADAAMATGGIPTSTGGTTILTGGVAAPTGGTVVASGGVVARTGGVPPASGGKTTTGGSSPPTGGAAATGGQIVARDAAASDTPLRQDATTTSTDGGYAPGNPTGACSLTLPARGHLVDTSAPTTVVGSGTPDSCTFAQLKSAVATGGIVTFNCGPSPVVIPVTEPLRAPITKNTVLDGAGLITLDGGNTTQILRFDSPDFGKTGYGLTLQRLTFVRGKATPTTSLPAAPAPCSQGYTDGQGGAVYVRDGSLTVIDCVFTGNNAAQIGPDTGGGAIYMLGSKDGLVVVGSTFTNNTASNAGAIGCLFSELSVYTSLFSGNLATGHDANDVKPAQCSVGEGQIGSGGNGGALYSDGQGKNILLCGNAVLNNKAGQNACGGGVFFTSNDFTGTLTIVDTTMTGNTGCAWTNVASGSVKNAGSAVGTNCKSLSIVNSTLQGL